MFLNQNKPFNVIFVIICIILLFLITYILFNFGNNKFRYKNDDEIVENILDSFLEFEAQIDVDVISNKTKNSYKIYQKINKEIEYIKILSPDEIRDLEIIFERKKLVINNISYGMKKEYNNYKNLLNSSLELNVFVKDYYKSKSKNFYEENDEIIIEVLIDKSNSTYAHKKILYIDKKTCLPKKLIVEDSSQEKRICIIYSDIKIK